MAHHNNKGSWSFLQNLIMAILSVALLFIVGIFFFSIFISEELDAQDRLDMISSALERPIDDESYQFVSFDVAKGEFMVIYKQGFNDGDWPSLTDDKSVGVCIGKTAEEISAEGAICNQVEFVWESEDEWGEPYVMLYILGIDRSHFSEIKDGGDVIAYKLEPSNTRSYFLEIEKNTIRVRTGLVSSEERKVVYITIRSTR
ncbi:MAG: hypothetical protein ACMXYL_04620 [Candidatus Woesearchaeota archaeon]